MKKRVCLLTLLFSANIMAKMQAVELNVPSMNCATCPLTVKKSLDNVQGVHSVEVTYKPKVAKVTFDNEYTEIEALMAATKNAGYPSTLVHRPGVK